MPFSVADMLALNFVFDRKIKLTMAANRANKLPTKSHMYLECGIYENY